MKKENQYPSQGCIASGRFIFKNDLENGIEDFFDIEIAGPSVNMQLLQQMSAMIKPGHQPVAILLCFTDGNKQSKLYYHRQPNEYSKNIPEEKFTNLLEDNSPKTSASKVFKSSSGYLNKKQETQEEILKRYRITEREKQVIFYLCQELRNIDIGIKLNIDVRQVEALRKSIMDKLAALNVVGIAFFAVSAGIVELPEA
jgi:DNA-binding CsgD family transcriptional regulator